MKPIFGRMIDRTGGSCHLLLMRVERVIGDGGEWLWLQYDSPDAYAIRVPTGTRKLMQGDLSYFYSHTLEDAEAAVAQEFGERFAARCRFGVFEPDKVIS